MGGAAFQEQQPLLMQTKGDGCRKRALITQLQLIRIYTNRQVLVTPGCWVLKRTASVACQSIQFHTCIHVCVYVLRAVCKVRRISFGFVPR